VNSWQAEFVAADGPRLHYTRTGGDKPPLVLAHGITDDGLCWSRVAAELAPDYDVVMVDARGHGRSDAPESGYDPGQQADDLAGVIAALGLQTPDMLGHSMGAATTLVLAGTHPDVPGAVLLEDSPRRGGPIGTTVRMGHRAARRCARAFSGSRRRRGRRCLPISARATGMV
jgi:N-formylmaleamate deformylase